MIASQIKQKIHDAVTGMGISVPDIAISHPENTSFGDYSTNIALRLAKELKKAPLEIAQEIASNIEKGDLIEKIEAVKPGFINIFLSQQTLLSQLQPIIESEQYGAIPAKNQKVMMEFGQPNTHKLPHIGHLFSYIYGESMARIFEYQGKEVFRANYQGDIGLHVAKCLWSVLKNPEELPREKSLEEKARFLQIHYQKGSVAYDESEQSKKEIDELNKKIYQEDSEIYDIWQETRQWCVDFYKHLEQRLGINYNKSYFETMTAPIGKKTVLDNVGKVFEESEDAIIFRGENYGQHTRVFINKFGNPTYEGKDTGLIQLKAKDFSFDQSYVSTAIEQKNYWDTVITACELLFPHLKGKLNHIDFGMINLSTGKMSSRTGNIIDALGLIELVKNEIKKDYPNQPDDVVDTVALASIKYSFLKTEVFKNKAFDIETSISKEGDSGPYVLYTIVRCNSILEKDTANSKASNTSIEITDEEKKIMQLLYQFPEVISLAESSKSPHHIATYLFDIAQSFNLFYQKHPILKADDKTKNFRLLLTRSTKKILENGLSLLGIKTVQKM